MPTNALEIVAVVSIIASVLSALLIVGDMAAGRRQKMWIMEIVWPLTALYFGPIGLWAYWTMGRPKPEGASEKPYWQTVFVATCHCGAGCTLGDAIGETAIYFFGITLFGSKLLTAYAADFTLAYLTGIIFQYFTIAPMRNLGLKDGLIAAAKADTISLVAFEVGMFGWMALNNLVFFEHPPEPNTFVYWFLMQIAMIVGFATSYPANWLLVKFGLKEKM